MTREPLARRSAAPSLLRDLDRKHRRRAVALTIARIIVVWVVLLAAYFVAPFDGKSADNYGFRVAASILLLIVVLAWEVWRTSQSSIPQLRAVSALGAVFPLLLVIFASTYLSMSRSAPSSFNESLNHVSALYFTVTTLATVGFGDISAASNGARVLVTVQTILDLLLLGGVVRLLTAAVRTDLDRSQRAPDDRTSPLDQ